MARCLSCGKEKKGEICVTQCEVNADEPLETIDVLTDRLHTVSAMREEEESMKYLRGPCGVAEEMIESAAKVIGEDEKIMEVVE